MSLRVRRLNRERWAGFLGLPFFVAAIFAETPLIRLGCAIFAVSWAYTLYRTTRANWDSVPTADCATHYRSHLVRMHNSFRNLHYWSSFPSSTGVAIATLGWYLAEPSRFFEISMTIFSWTGFQIALWAHRSTRLAQWQRDIDLLEE